MVSRKIVFTSNNPKAKKTSPPEAAPASSTSANNIADGHPQDEAHQVIIARHFLNSIARGDVVGMKTFTHENCIVYFADDVELIISDLAE